LGTGGHLTVPGQPRAPTGSAEVGIDRRWLISAARVVLRRPGLWPVALVQLRRLAAPGWWRHRPFLPLPDSAYLRFRLETMYGGDVPHRPEPADLVAFLRWSKAANGR